MDNNLFFFCNLNKDLKLKIKSINYHNTTKQTVTNLVNYNKFKIKLSTDKITQCFEVLFSLTLYSIHDKMIFCTCIKLVWPETGHVSNAMLYTCRLISNYRILHFKIPNLRFSIVKLCSQLKFFNSELIIKTRKHVVIYIAGNLIFHINNILRFSTFSCGYMSLPSSPHMGDIGQNKISLSDHDVRNEKEF
ncbi:hypothetical protein AGLY_013435 [Aphis glycines]|uniref:Uncharacterized protein n=1 Tax=Aphis glycines TaxID=307491 RepID=A0A6G0T6G8_APHGL|nr:hypothetical protein AGLY_013435 [Aphis glycines]